jgi:hypothetical protein
MNPWGFAKIVEELPNGGVKVIYSEKQKPVMWNRKSHIRFETALEAIEYFWRHGTVHYSLEYCVKMAKDKFPEEFKYHSPMEV